MKVALFTDIHFGKHQHSRKYNEAALGTVKEFIKLCSRNGIQYGCFLGDWHEHRITIDVSTMNFSYQALEALNEYFSLVDGKLYFIIGNHDLYYRHTRDIHSIPFTNQMAHIQPIDSPQVVSIGPHDVLMVPWLEHGENLAEIVTQYSGVKYLFGHQEYSGFRWNHNSYALTPGVPTGVVKHFDRVLSGHYHMRQSSGNITYIGSCLQQNFGDCGDERGFAILDLEGNEMEFIENSSAPRFVKKTVSEALKSLSDLKGNYVRVIEDKKLPLEVYNKVMEVLHDCGAIQLSYESYKESDECIDEEIDTDNLGLEDVVVELLESLDRDDKESLKTMFKKFSSEE